MNQDLLNQLFMFLGPLGLTALWFTYRSFATAKEARQFAEQYKPSIHGEDYRTRYFRMHTYFTSMCMLATVMWILFVACLLIVYFGGQYETS